jgi:hypothetical protein
VACIVQSACIPSTPRSWDEDFVQGTLKHVQIYLHSILHLRKVVPAEYVFCRNTFSHFCITDNQRTPPYDAYSAIFPERFSLGATTGA